MDRLVALGALVIIIEDDPDKTTKGGLVLPSITHQTQLFATGEIVGVGPGYYDNGVLVKPEVEVGQKVLYVKTSSNRWQDPTNGKWYTIMPAGNLLARLNDV